ncbi:MAG: CDGSH iron-sulfur domain-containing protein [Stappiaceae bacterium]
MEKAKIAQKEPFAVDVQEGKTYFWCACGRSSKQPFCDGSHKDTDFTPVAWKAEVSGKKFFCGCKATGKQPFCDGSHSGL